MCTTNAATDCRSSMAATAVIGAGGPTGCECVKRLLELGEPAVAIVRDPQKYKNAFKNDKNLTLLSGDVTDAASLKSAFKEGHVKNVIFAASGKTYWSAKSVDEQGVGNTLEAAASSNVNRIVLVSSALVTPKNRFHPIRLILNNIRWGLMDAKFRGENLLREGSVPFTVVRPGGLTNDPPGQKQVVASQGDTGSAGRIARSDVARVCVAALKSTAAKNVTLELFSKDGTQGPSEVDSIFNGLKPDSGPAK